MQHQYGRVASKAFSPNAWNAFLSEDGRIWSPLSTDHTSMYNAMESVSQRHDLRAPGWERAKGATSGKAFEVAITHCRCEE